MLAKPPLSILPSGAFPDCYTHYINGEVVALVAGCQAVRMVFVVAAGCLPVDWMVRPPRGTGA